MAECLSSDSSDKELSVGTRQASASLTPWTFPEERTPLHVEEGDESLALIIGAILAAHVPHATWDCPGFG